MRTSWNITRKELRASLNGATTYLVGIVFLLLWEFLFFRNVFLVGEASLRGLFDMLPWLLLILIPALTMGAISQEKRDGTLEVVLTHSVRDRDLLVGKFLSALAIVGTLLVFTFPIALSIGAHGNLDWGEYFGQFLAALLLAASMTALGLFVSSLLPTQVGALLVTAAASFGLIVIGDDLVAGRLPLALSALLERLSLSSHYQSMARGVIDLRDLWYFATFIAIFLAATMLVLMRRRFGGRRTMYRRAQIMVGLLVVIAVLVNIIGGRIPGRIDLTDGGRYSVSEATRDTLKGLEDVVRITMYASSELPAQMQPTLRDATDLLRDYDRIGGRDVAVKVNRIASSKSDAADDARAQGIQEVQFNVVGDEEFALKQGFMGIVVSYGGEEEVIPFISDTGDLEYQLTSLIVQLTTDDKAKVAVVSTDEKLQLQALTQELSRQFEVSPLPAAQLDSAALSGVQTLVLAGTGSALTNKGRSAIKKYLKDGGSALVLAEGVSVDLQTSQAKAVENGLSTLVEPYGVEVRTQLAVDSRAATSASFGGPGGMSYVMPYALWPQAKAAPDHAASKDIKGVSLLWASPLTVDKKQLAKDGQKSTSLLTTSSDAGVMSDTFDINPQNQPDEVDDPKKLVLATAIEPIKDKKGEQPRLVVVGDADFVNDQLASSSPRGIPFALQSTSWLARSDSLASIRIKNSAERTLHFKEKGSQAQIRWMNMLLALMLPAVFALWRITRRRRLSRYTFDSRPPNGIAVGLDGRRKQVDKKENVA